MLAQMSFVKSNGITSVASASFKDWTNSSDPTVPTADRTNNQKYCSASGHSQTKIAGGKVKIAKKNRP